MQQKMMELVAFLGSDKENWGQITALLKRMKWDRVVLVKNKDASEFPDYGTIIKINTEKPLLELKDELINELKEKLTGDLEVILSIASGNGKEHMALISALLAIPVGIRLAAFTRNGVQFL